MANLAVNHDQVLSVVKSTTTDVFATMLGMPVVAKDTFVELPSTATNEGLVAVVGMAGTVSGSGSLCISGPMACRAAGRFLMSDYTEVNDEVLDAISELANMIVGGLKTSLEEDFGPMGLSMPTVVFGKDYVTRNSSMGERVSVSFEYDEDGVHESFNVVACLIGENSNRNYLRELAKFHADLV